MTLIHSVSSEKQSLIEKLQPHLGITLVHLQLAGGLTLSGIITEIGEDYLSLLNPEQQASTQNSEQETLVPLAAIVVLRLKPA